MFEVNKSSDKVAKIGTGQINVNLLWKRYHDYRHDAIVSALYNFLRSSPIEVSKYDTNLLEDLTISILEAPDEVKME